LTGNAGILGTGLSYRERFDLSAKKQDQVATTNSESSGSGLQSILLVIIVLLIGIFIGLSLR